MTHMTTNNHRCRRCGKPYTSTTHMRECRGMSIKQRNTARSHRASIQRASRARSGNIFASAPMASASYYDDTRKTEPTQQEAGA